MEQNKTIKFRIKTSTNQKFGETVSVLENLARIYAKTYNTASLTLFDRITKSGSLKKQEDEKGWTTELVYHPAMDNLKISYLALGLVNKIKANYTGSKMKDIMAGRSLPPFMRSNFINIYKQGGFNFGFEKVFEDGKQELLIDIPIPDYIERPKADWKTQGKYEFLNKTKYITLWLMTNAWKNKQQIGEIAGKKITTIEIQKSAKKNNQGYNKWMIAITYQVDLIQESLDQNRKAIITFDFETPITCEMPGGKKLKIKNNEAYTITKMQLRRIKEQSLQSGYNRTGHGKKHKFANIEKISNKYRERRKKCIEKWVTMIDKSLISNNIGKITIKKPDIEEKKKSLLLRLYWPVSEIVEKLTNRLKQTGITIEP